MTSLESQELSSEMLLKILLSQGGLVVNILTGAGLVLLGDIPSMIFSVVLDMLLLLVLAFSVSKGG